MNGYKSAHSHVKIKQVLSCTSVRRHGPKQPNGDLVVKLGIFYGRDTVIPRRWNLYILNM